MYKVINEYINSYQELHDKYPDMEAVIYRRKENGTRFDGGMLYGIADDDDICVLMCKCLEEMPNENIMSLHTSPTDFYGNPYFKD